MLLCDKRHCDLEPEGNSFQFLVFSSAKPKQTGKGLKSHILINTNIRLNHDYCQNHQVLVGFVATVKTHLETKSVHQLKSTSSILTSPRTSGGWADRSGWRGSVSTANQHVIVSCVMHRGNSPNYNPHSLHASGNVCQVSSSLLRVPPPPPPPPLPSCSVSLSYSHFRFLLLYIYRSGPISGALICGFNPPRLNGCF